MERRLVVYGDVPASITQQLVARFGAELMLSSRTFYRGMLDTLKACEYDVALIATGAEHGDTLERGIRQMGEQSGRDAAVIRVAPDAPPADVVSRVELELGWLPLDHTHFIVVTTAKGGVGKSTCAGALAVVLAQERGKRVLGVDDNPVQANLMRFFTDEFAALPISCFDDVVGTADEYLVNTYHEDERGHLDLLLPTEYGRNAGVTYSVATAFWKGIRSLGYDYVIVDTAPTLYAPKENNMPEYTHVPLTYALIAAAQEKHNYPVYVVPFTPVTWGWQGLEKTRDLLRQWQLEDQIVPVVTATDMQHTLENVPDWVLTGLMGERLSRIPYSRDIRTQSHVRALRRRPLRDPIRPYRGIVDTAQTVGDELNGGAYAV